MTKTIMIQKDEPCIAFVKQMETLNIFSEQQIKYICSKFVFEEIPRNKFFLQAGKRSARIGYLIDGIFCSYITTDQADVVVKYFIENDQFFTDISAYENNCSSYLNIQAVVDSSILYIHKTNNDLLIKEIPAWKHALSVFSSNALNRMIRNQNFLYSGSSLDKYRIFVKDYPNLARQVPLKLIASYLGITQSSLSRIRREV